MKYELGKLNKKDLPLVVHYKDDPTNDTQKINQWASSMSGEINSSSI